MEKEYKLHFRNAGVPFVVVELTFSKGAYGDFDYLILYKGDLTEGYLSQQGLEQTKAFGLKLLDNFEEVHKRISEFKAKLEKFAYTDWKDLKKLFKEFGTFYRYCEQPMLAGLEEIFTKNCDNPEEYIKNPKNVKINIKGKRALEIITKLGQMKYDLHILIEKPILALFELIQNFPSFFTLTEKEIDNLLENKVKIEKIKNREALVIYEGRIEFNYDTWKNKLKKGKEFDIIKGRGVSSGKVQGPVKKFISSMGFTEIPPGSILVSGMTNPQMVPYLKKAAAIITDEGGITCHAAIIARELGIPCVVGTEYATEILNDGDLVEVDADKGIIKILN